MKCVLAFLATLIACQAHAEPPRAPELVKAEAEILAGLSEADQAWARRLSDPAKVPTLKIGGGPLELPTGAWGRLERIEMVERGRGVERIAGFTDFSVDEIVDARTMLIHEHSLWVEGVETTDLTDESNIDLASYVFEVVGVKRYPTAIGGTRTVKRLRAVNLGKVAIAGVRLGSLRGFRTWRDKSGKFEVLARYVGFKGGKVQLEGLDGKQAAVALVRLADEEQAYVREAVKAAKPKMPKR